MAERREFPTPAMLKARDSFENCACGDGYMYVEVAAKKVEVAFKSTADAGKWRVFCCRPEGRGI